jgi:hypothetical protein
MLAVDLPNRTLMAFRPKDVPWNDRSNVMFDFIFAGLGFALIAAMCVYALLIENA